MRLPASAATAAALIVLVFSGAAETAPGTTPRTVTDRAGDGKAGPVDIKSASAQLSSSAQFDVWTVVSYKPFTTRQAPCIDVTTVHPSGIEWSICGTAAGGFGLSTSKPYPAGGGYAGTAAVSRPNNSTIVYRVPRKTFDLTRTNFQPKPLGVAWQVQVRESPACDQAVCDRAPDSSHLSFQP